jgi:glutamate decarboxylase
MVHLAEVLSDKQILAQSPTSITNVEFPSLNEDSSSFTASVYGSKWAEHDLPKHEIPDDSMPKEIAYRMIKDDLTLAVWRYTIPSNHLSE